MNKIRKLYEIGFLFFVVTIFSIIFTTCVSSAPVVDTGEANVVITVDTGVRYQYVRGFGGMYNVGLKGWSHFPITTERDAELLFNPDTGLGLNMMRLMIMPWNTDISITMNEILTTGMPEFYENVKIVNKYGGYVLASPWTPPAEWKSNKSINGSGTLLPEHYQDYADYLKSFAQIMYDNGAPIYAISISNEPNYTASYDGCLWSPNQMRDFFVKVGRFTEGVRGFGGGKETPFVLTMNGESMNNPNINDTALNNPVSRAAVDLIGRHKYGDGKQTRYALAHDHPTDPKEVWMTEYLLNSGNASVYHNDSKWNYVWKIMNDIDMSVRLNDENAYIWWAMKRFYCFMGDGQFNTVEGEILPRGYGISHYAKFAKETYRVGVTAEGRTGTGAAINARNFNNKVGNEDGLSARATAFVSPDGGTISLVMFTPSGLSGSGGVDMGTVKIQLPQDFIISEAEAMRSTENNYAKWEEVEILEDRTSALVTLPRGNILSVRFKK